MDISNSALSSINHVLSSKYVLVQDLNTSEIIPLLKPEFCNNRIIDELGYKLELQQYHKVVATNSCIVIYSIDNTDTLVFTGSSNLSKLHNIVVTKLRTRVTKLAFCQQIDTSSFSGIASDTVKKLVENLQIMKNPTNFATNTYKVKSDSLEVSFTLEILNLDDYIDGKSAILEYNIIVNIPKYKFDTKSSTLLGVLTKLYDYLTVAMTRKGIV